MSKMKLPGFTAAAALPMAGGRYQMDGNYEGPESADRSCHRYQSVIAISRKRALSDAAPRPSTMRVTYQCAHYV